MYPLVLLFAEILSKPVEIGVKSQNKHTKMLLLLFRCEDMTIVFILLLLFYGFHAVKLLQINDSQAE